MVRPLVLLCLFLFARVLPAQEYDVVIYGATPAGITAALAAGREKASVAIIEPSPWSGGMVAGGLSSTDLGNPNTIGGLAREFFERCNKYYPGQPLWYAEPHVYQKVFAEMLQESGALVVLGQTVGRIAFADATTPKRILSLTTADGRTFRGKVFIDATYEGDLMALADVPHLLGRESRDEFGEPLAGFRLDQPREFPVETMTQGCPCVGGTGPHYVHGAPTRISAFSKDGSLLWGVRRSEAAPGSADRLTQSYNYRLCVTREPGNRVSWPKPQNYYPERYELLLRLIQTYPGMPFSRLVHLAKLPNGKFDLNAQGLFSTDYVDGNRNYIEGDRLAVRQDHLDYVQGLFWFLTHDERLPKPLREEAASYGLCRDEFADNSHWPYALYVREARRMRGEFIMTQRDVQREVVKPDSIGMGSFIIDSHIVQRIVSKDGYILDEGAFDAPARPYQIPYRSLTPPLAACANLLVPVCLSASHIAYCSIRMEPVYMAMGHAAGLAAAAAAQQGIAVQAVEVSSLQEKLRAQKAVLALPGQADLIWPEDLPGAVQDDEQAEVKGAWSNSPYGNPVGGGARNDGNAGKGEKTVRYTLNIPAAGRYELRLSYTPAPNRATNVPVLLQQGALQARVQLDQRAAPNAEEGFSRVGTYSLQGGPVTVEISTAGTNGYVVADCVQLLPAP